MQKNKSDDVRIITFVSRDCWKKLKIMAVQKDNTMQEMVCDVLERAMAKSKTIEKLSDE